MCTIRWQSEREKNVDDCDRGRKGNSYMYAEQESFAVKVVVKQALYAVLRDRLRFGVL